MELFKALRLSMGRMGMKRRSSRLRRTRFNGNLKNARSIGIVWDASRPDEFRILSQFHQKMQERNIEVKIIGWYPEKILPDKLTAIRYLSVIKRENLNFVYVPISQEANEFMNRKFDIVIDLNFENIFPLAYISSLSVAGLKVGIFEENNKVHQCDMMLQMSKKTDKGEYLAQVVHYLEMVNRDSDK